MNIREIGGVAVISTNDRLDALAAPELKEMIKGQVESGKKRIVIDLGSTRFIDSSGCGVLVASLRSLLKEQGDMRIAAPNPQAQTLFQLTRLDRVFEIFDTVELALSSFPTS
jgi:anti-anti-sigma factor